jgi:dTDP-glucose 4,6-dehydratase
MSAAAAGADALEPDLEHVLTHTRSLWETARGGRFFVTGGTGFFGRWLLETFAHANRSLELGARMTVLSRNPSAFSAKAPHLGASAGIEFVSGDVQNLSPALVGSDARFDFVIHAATESSTNLGAENPLAMLDSIVGGTRAALDFARATGAQRFLLTSSGAVYGRQPADVTHVPETFTGAADCTDPASCYGEGKRIAELLCTCYHRQHGLDAVIARCFAFVGPFLPLDVHFAVGNFIRDALRGGPIRIGGDGTPRRSYLYAADLAIWLWTLLFQGQPARPYNVGSAADVSIRELAEAVRAAVAPAIAIEQAKTPVPNVPPSRYVPDVSRAREELGLSALVNLEDAIGRTAAFHRHANASPADASAR